MEAINFFFACISKCWFPDQWKVAQIKMVSYRPISLLPVLSKVLQIIFLNRLISTIGVKNLTQSSIRISQRSWNHRTSASISRKNTFIFWKKEYCTAAFLDISQAFDKVWQDGLMFKLKKPTKHSNLRSLMLSENVYQYSKA